MRLLDDMFTGPARPGSVSGLKWSTRIQATGEVQHVGWTKSRGPVNFLNDQEEWYGSQCPRAQRAIENHYVSWKGYQKGLKSMLDDLDLEDPAVLNEIADNVDPRLLRLGDAEAPAPTRVTGEEPISPEAAPPDTGYGDGGGSAGEIGIIPLTGGHHAGMAD